MHDFLKIVWFLGRRRGLDDAWKRTKAGFYGYTHPRCIECKGHKGLNSSPKCSRCILAPVGAAINRLLGIR